MPSREGVKPFRYVHNIQHMGVYGHRCVATIGSFDGIHRGHQVIFEQVRELGRRYALPTVVVLFEPQPREYISREKTPARLMRIREKVAVTLALGIDQVVCLRFNSELYHLSAQDFVVKVLIEGLGVRSLVVGDDSRFGAGRVGDFNLLQAMGSEHGFSVIDTRTVLLEGERVSSTRIRAAVAAADFELAARLLGRPFQICGRVVHGQKLGRQVGVPTANIHLHRYRAPLHGVYAVRVHRGDQSWPGVANVGLRPTVSDLNKPILEVHVIDRNEDVYGQYLSVEFCHKLRDEQKFEGLEALVTAIRNDIAQAKAYFGL